MIGVMGQQIVAHGPNWSATIFLFYFTFEIIMDPLEATKIVQRQTIHSQTD